MTILVTGLWLSLVHATVYALLGILFYLALRRLGPAAGALAAGSSLVAMAGVAILAFSPWPRWAVDDLVKNSRLASLHLDIRDDAREIGESSITPGVPLATRTSSAAERTAPVNWAQDRPWLASALSRVFTPAWDNSTNAGAGSPRNWRSWLALAMLSSTALGLVRLVSGLLSIRSLRVHSKLVNDRAMIDTLALLRAEMGCTRPVELRTSAKLATPATIGCRHAIVLLPRDWQAWNDDERRAVLAHELAHVCRGDFATGLLAQIGLSVQFHHPLAHWLSSRLRLEQELAADAWSARLTGGSLRYLTTLAQMALRRDDQALSWPARAFLPSRGTFVRRIEMLRDSKRVRHVGLSVSMRVLTIGALAALGILIAGLRGPLALPQAQAQPPAEGRGPLAAGANPTSIAIDLTYLPADTSMFVAVRPAALLSGQEWRPLLEILDRNELLRQAFLLPLDEIDQLLLFWHSSAWNTPDAGPSPLFPAPSGVLVRATKSHDWSKVLDRVAPGMEQIRHAGQTYFRPAKSTGRPSSPSVYATDDRTAVLASDELLRSLIEDRKEARATHSWDDAWNQLAQGQINAALETRWLRRRLDQGQIKLGTIAPLFEQPRGYAASIRVDRDLTIDARATTGDADGVKPVTETIQALLTLGRNSLPSLREHADNSGPLREAHAWALSTLANLLDKARVETKDRSVHFQATSTIDVATAARVLSSLLSSAQSESARLQSINNLKQIGLAIYNYADVNKHLPPPVLYGGKSGKVPHSWRVAILPYLEQQDLYNAYNFDEPWDGPTNSKLLDKMPSIYAYPTLGGRSKTYTAYFVFTGKEALLGSGEKPKVDDVSDTAHCTILAVEAQREVPWTKPEDIPFSSDLPAPRIGGFSPECTNVLLGDGSIGTIKTTIDPKVLKALITRAGGEVIPSGSF